MTLLNLWMLSSSSSAPIPLARAKISSIAAETVRNLVRMDIIGPPSVIGALWLRLVVGLFKVDTLGHRQAL